MAMKTKLTKIGNAWFLRIPKSALRQLQLGDSVEVMVERRGLIVCKADPRAGWEEAARLMAQRGDDNLIDGPLPSLTSFDESDWAW